MRVLIVTNMWPTPERPALGSFVRDQVEALRKIDGLEVEVFAFIPTGGLRPYFTAARALRRKFKGDEYDIVHAHYGLSAWSALAVRAKHRVVTFHGTDLGHHIAGPLSRRVLNRVDLPATASAWLARSQGPGIAGAGTTRRVAVLPCGVRMERFGRIDRRDARRQLGLDPDGRFVLFPADPKRPEKRFDRAERVAKELDAQVLTYDSTLPEDVPVLINAANVVLVTSEREGFGLAALEALACDVPVTSTDVGIAPLALSGVDGTRAMPFDAHRWVEWLRQFVDDADPRIDGRARAALFDSNRMAMRVFQVYRALMNEDG